MRFVWRPRGRGLLFLIIGLTALCAGCDDVIVPGDGGSGAAIVRCTAVNARPGPLSVGPELTDDQLAESFTSIQGVLQARTVIADAQANAEAIRAAVQTAPHVVDTGIAVDCSVWIRFTDGSPLSVFADRRSLRPGDPDPLDEPVAPGTTTASAGQAHDVRAAAPEGRAAAATEFAIPDSANARIGYSDNLALHALPFVKAALDKRGYLVSTGAVTADLRTGVRDLGVLWLSTHGVFAADDQGNMHYAIATDEPLDPKLGACTLSPQECALNRADKKALRAGRGILPNGSRASFVVNEAWVATYWSFAQDSVVVIDACNALDDAPEVEAFRRALKNAGAGTVLGWHGVVDARFAEKAMTFFFEGTLGGNTYRKLSPPQRPFSVAEVLAAMAPAGLILDPSGPAVLGRKQFSRAEPILAPSIQNLTVLEKQADTELTLVGEFPAQPVVLEISGTPMSATGGSSQLVTTIPNAGQGSSGPVEVKVPRGSRTITSNRVPLTSWRGSYRVRYIMIGLYGAPGPYVELKCSAMHFRGDVHRYRLKPEETARGGAILPSGARSELMSFINVTADSQCEGITGGAGERPAGEIRTEFASAPLPLPWVDTNAPDKPDRFFDTTPNIDTASLKLTLIPNAFMSTTMTMTILRTNPPVISTTPNLLVSIAPLVPTLGKRPIQLDAATFGASQSTTMFSVSPLDQCEEEYSLGVEQGSAPTPNTEG